VGEQRHVAISRAGPGYYPIDPRTHLLRHLAAGAAIPKDQPSWRAFVDLFWR
jgi:hypothetical protein